MVLAKGLALLLNAVLALASSSRFPEQRSDLQQFQDISKCFPDIGNVYMMYRNYYSDKVFGGSSKCVNFDQEGSYENFTTTGTYFYGTDGSTSGEIGLSSSPCYTGKNQVGFQPDGGSFSEENFSIIFTDCACFVIRHLYIQNGAGCSLWRIVDKVNEPTDYCDFIYAENCGTSPQYSIYDRSCHS